MGTDNNKGDHDLPEHALQFLEMAFRTDRQGRPAAPSGTGRNVGRRCRDSITIYISVQKGILQKVAFEMDGCLNTAACANAVAELVEGVDLETAWKLTPERVASYLQTLPSDHFHCAELAVGALSRALTDYQQNAAKEWQALYRKHA